MLAVNLLNTGLKTLCGHKPVMAVLAWLRAGIKEWMCCYRIAFHYHRWIN